MKIGYHSTIIDVSSGKGKLAFITVFNAGTEDKSTIYLDVEGSSLNNPFQTDMYGRFSFFATSGAYDIEVSGIGIVTYKLEGVSIMGLSFPPKDMYGVVNFFYNPSTDMVEVITADKPAK